MSGDLNSWIDAYGLPVTTVQPVDGTTREQLGIRETSYVVDLGTMEIVGKLEGSLAGAGDSAGKTGIAELEKHLGS